MFVWYKVSGEDVLLMWDKIKIWASITFVFWKVSFFFVQHNWEASIS